MSTAPLLQWTLRDTLRALRKSRDWKQAELAQRSGVNQVTISRIESGKVKDPEAKTIERLAGAYGLTYEEVLALRAGDVPTVTPGHEENDMTYGEELRRIDRILSLLPDDAARERLQAFRREVFAAVAEDELGGPPKKGEAR